MKFSPVRIDENPVMNTAMAAGTTSVEAAWKVSGPRSCHAPLREGVVLEIGSVVE